MFFNDKSKSFFMHCSTKSLHLPDVRNSPGSMNEARIKFGILQKNIGSRVFNEAYLVQVTMCRLSAVQHVLCFQSSILFCKSLQVYDIFPRLPSQCMVTVMNGRLPVTHSLWLETNLETFA